VVKLDRVYRQDSGSRVAVNASLIRHGEHSLEYGEDFRFRDSSDFDESADLIETLYLEEVARCGVDNVALLTPFRQKTATGVYALNDRLRVRVNPPTAGKPEILCGKRLFCQGDKVMQLKNSGDVNNGDVGYITHITKVDGDTTATVLAVPGVNALLQLERTLSLLRESGVRKISTAFDMDFLRNRYVQNGYNELTALLGNMGFRYNTLLWNPDYNGLDDYVWECCLNCGSPRG
jgi:hypothetical protein